MRAVWALSAGLLFGACALDRSGLATDGPGSDGGADDAGAVDADGTDTGREDAGAVDAGSIDAEPTDGGVTDPDAGAIDAAGATPTELPAAALSVYDTDSATGSADRSLDENPDSRWTSFPDELPRYIAYRLDRSYLVAGVSVDSNLWSPCGQSDVYLSADGTTWGTPVARYTAADPLPNGTPAIFASPAAAQFVKIVVNARTDGGSYCYIAEFRVLVLDP